MALGGYSRSSTGVALLLAAFFAGLMFLTGCKRAEPSGDGSGPNEKMVGTPADETAKVSGGSSGPNPRFAGVSKTDFSKVDYSKGPNGEPITEQEGVQDGHRRVAKGFTRSGRFVQHGLTRIYYPSGKKKNERYWFDGKQHGHVVFWHPNGTKEAEFDMAENKTADGVSVWWHDTGAKKFERAYRDGRSHGPFVSYYRSGQAMCEVEYEAGKYKPATEQWFDAKGGKADGPTVSALTKLDFIDVLEYRLKNDPNPSVVQGQISPPDEKFGRANYEVLVNFQFDYYLRFLGKPDAGYGSDFVKQAEQDWTYQCSDGPLRLHVYCGRPIAGKEGVVPGKAERVVIKKLNL